MFSASEAISPKSFLNLLPIVILSIVVRAKSLILECVLFIVSCQLQLICLGLLQSVHGLQPEQIAVI
jgi:hypothetical protein